MSYIGNSLTQQSFTGGMDQFNGNASNTTFGLSRPVNTPFDINVFVESVFQRPGVAYTTSANTITFTSAPSVGANNIVVVYENFTSTSVVPAPGSVSTSSLGLISNINAGPNNGLSLQANNATVITADSSGQVGVGVVPVVGGATKLNVAGRGLFTGGAQDPGDTTAAGVAISYSGNTGYIGAIQTGVANWPLFVHGSPIRFGTSTTNELMRLNNNGALVLAGGNQTATGTGIAFPATQNPSSDANTLDDYEEGTWTPVVTPSTGTITSQTCSGNYIKVGRLVTLTFNAQMLTGTMTAVSQITGLPFVISTGTPVGASREWYASGNMWELIGNNGAATLSLIRYDNSSVCNAQFAWNGTFTYITNN